jgi:transmembrane sensor
VNDSLDWKILDRYLAGEASLAEEQAVQAWIDAAPARGELVQALRARGNGAGNGWDVDAAWKRVSPTVSAPAAPSHAAQPVAPHAPGAIVEPPRRLRSNAFRIAAGFLLVAGSLAAWQLLTPRGSSGGATVAMSEVVTPNGSRSNITLYDGTRVTLNAGSRLRYPTAAGRGARDLYLVGEGYFEVTHDAAHPFRVHAGGGLAEDLGTRFTVRAYPEMARVEVVVAEGKVSLRRDRDTGGVAVLGPGQLGRLAGDGAPVIESNVDLDRYLGWTGGALVLERITLADALPQLERRYDVRIVLADAALGRRQLSTRLRDETLTQALDALSLALGVRYERAGRTITLRGVQ